MVQVAAHLSVAELQAGYRGSKDATLARHFQVIWLLAQGYTVPETARLTGFVRRWVEELLVRYNRFGPASLGDRRQGNGAKPRLLTPEILAMLRAGEDPARRRRGLDREEGGGADRRRARVGKGRRAARLGGAPRDRLDNPAPAAARRAGGDARGAGGV